MFPPHGLRVFAPAALRELIPQKSKCQVAVIAAVMYSSVRLPVSNDHAFARTNYNSCIPSSSVTNLRNMLESCENEGMMLVLAIDSMR